MDQFDGVVTCPAHLVTLAVVPVVGSIEEIVGKAKKVQRLEVGKTLFGEAKDEPRLSLY
jgi:hypothetical protein